MALQRRLIEEVNAGRGTAIEENATERRGFILSQMQTPVKPTENL